ncbi:DUF1894 domain-containing protein [Methanosphaerula subterraneus]|uniref:DUF1894 domain-containing protein n=1 Tax=Methanosphaerula subterraneus TaxID=3350244 RepID=UPI003F8248AB
MILPLGASFRECREYAEKNYQEIWYVDPGYRLFDEYIIGLPPIALGIEEGKKIIFPFTKPCHGTGLLGIEDTEEVERVRKTARWKK